jgi:hypothetical protein
MGGELRAPLCFVLALPQRYVLLVKGTVELPEVAPVAGALPRSDRRKRRLAPPPVADAPGSPFSLRTLSGCGRFI